MRILPSWAGWLGLGAALLLWIGFVGVPFGAVLIQGGMAGAAAWLDPLALSVVGSTIRQALVSTVLSSVLGLGLGLWFGRLAGSLDSRRTRWIEILLAIPFGVPTVVAASAWVMWLGRSGILGKLGAPEWISSNWIYSLRGVILAHVFLNLPWVALLVGRERARIPQSLLDAGRSLGAGRWSEFSHVVFPRIRATWLSATAQVFALCSMSFALVTLLGGGPPVQTVETALYSKVRYGTLDLEGAAVFAIWELLLTLVPWIIVLRTDPQAAEPRQGEWIRTRWVLTGQERTQWIVLSLICVGMILPYWVVVDPHGLADLWLKSEVRAEVGKALWISLRLAFSTASATLFAVGIFFTGSAVLRRSSFAWTVFFALSALPSGVSVLVLGLGFWLAYGKWLDPFSGNFFAITALQSAIFFPVALRVLWPLLNGTRTRLLDAAFLMGATPFQAFRAVEWPRWKPILRSAFALVAAASLGEVAAVSFFYSENLVPLPLVVSRWMSQYRFDEAQSVAALLFLVSGAITVSVFMGRSWVERSNR